MCAALKSLTLVVASQRSGSTLLCRDIESLGGLGVPREYFLKLLKSWKAGIRTLGEKDVVDQIAKGSDRFDPTIGAVKLMVDYAPKIDAIIHQRELLSPKLAVQSFIDWAFTRFERVNLIFLVREDSLDQAISKALWRLSGVSHLGEKSNQSDMRNNIDKALADNERLNQLILKFLPEARASREILEELYQANCGKSLLIRYSVLASDEKRIASTLIDYGRRNGFAPRSNKLTRNLKKIIKENDYKNIKENYERFISSELE
ncbi:MAG: Stf0 family sulfotransferase [Bacteroidota bacterium]